MGAINSVNGQMYYIVKDSYFNSSDTLEFLQLLSANVRNFAIFWDNASIHKNAEVKRYLKRNKIPSIFNIPYEPELNGIEVLWGTMKSKFRNRLLALKVANTKINLKEVVEQLLDEVTPQLVTNCTRHGWNNIVHD